MKKELNNLTYVFFDEEGLQDFKNLILPDVYEVLFLTDSFAEDAIVTVGALVDQVPVGAAVAQIFEDNIVNLSSIYVDEEYRNLGIGKGLMDSVLSGVYEYFDGTYDPELSSLDFALRTEFVLPKVEADAFESWMKKVKFTEINELPSVYFISDKLPKMKPKKKEEVYTLTSTGEFESEELEYYLRDAGLSPVDDLCFYTGNKEDMTAVSFVSSSDLEVFEISSMPGNTDEDPTEDEMLSLLDTTLNKIRESYPESSILIDGEKNLYEDVLKRVMPKENTYVHKEGNMYVRLSEE